MFVGAAGNSRASDERNRLMIALRGRQGDRVMRAARQLQDAEGLTLGDAARICAFLAEVDDDRFPVAAARLAARVTIASSLTLEDLDIVLDLVANLPDQGRFTELLRFCERADLTAAAERRRS